MVKKNRIEMYWDVGSTNTYFALKLIQPLLDRHQVELQLHPFNLGYVFRNNNYELMKESKAKLRNRKRDLMRWAEKYGLPFNIPREFPIKSSRALRGSLVARRHGKELEFVRKVMDRYWEQGDASIAEYAGLRPIARELGIDPDAFEALAASEEVAAELAEETNRGLERDVFGVPMIIVGDELFWGKDRMEFVEDEIKRQAAVASAA
ncbi:2-hydroxychromene-2-carboxylate isomerase [Achromobacter denitrificans]|nr:2-hydroxychromene-2-carboxylate isomerase [Achromobacter denitrificans]MDF3852274.1 2-hydroxychromene-2-carboxylate isomerase [Achromobacter denitrificans]MDF3941452.1 2-hydroxychromene-2-carboxylate isomerase [Achromobacter denitrificans]CAB3682569.1 2-hydroxychromene-2-carboxylate isomerase [Achromobacter denitrificans]CAB3910516.1 2-hydroxychromene-2-carboxylate isomerase [Achromobacter denitrificans]SUU24966.1 2-hydroxychromene-2-carboxylate isomerase [Achromobacter denitrificans]